MSDEGRASIFCPKCRIPTQVLDSRGTTENEVRRRRKCSDCGQRFTTYEAIYQRNGYLSPREKEHAERLIEELRQMLGLSESKE